MKHQKGFTLPELLIVGVFILWAVVVIAVICVVVHFVGKFW